MNDELGRPLVSESDLQRIRMTLSTIPEGKRGAILLIADESGTARAHVAAKINDSWKVAAGVGYDWNTKKPAWFIGLEYYF
jgi:hypothetical protein